MAAPLPKSLFQVVAGTEYNPKVSDQKALSFPTPHVDIKDKGEVSVKPSDTELVMRYLLSTPAPTGSLDKTKHAAPSPVPNKHAHVGKPVQQARVKLDERLDQIEARMDRQSEAVLSALKNHTTAPKSQVPPQPETAHNPSMTEVTRELLDAKLDSVRAEVRASIAESSKETVAAMGQLNTQMATMQGQMLTEMQGLRADFANMLKDVTKEMAATNVNVSQLGEKIAGVSGKVDGFEGKLTGLDGKITGLEGKIEGLDGKITGLDGKVTGLNSSISMLQWIVGSAIGLATIVLAIGAIFVAWMQLDLARQTSAPQTPAATQSAPAQPPK